VTTYPDGWYSAAVLGLDYPNLWKLAQVLAPAIEQARERARQVECASNLRQVALAAHLYANDHEGRLPAADNWVEALQPYFQNRDILRFLRCPDAPGQPVAYALNSRAAGQRIEDLPTDMVLFFETSKNEPNPADAGTSVAVRHPGGANYAFVDGHVIVSREPPRFAP
jgi:prepilin-type processing-associated H-X9-DG protein